MLVPRRVFVPILSSVSKQIWYLWTYGVRTPGSPTGHHLLVRLGCWVSPFLISILVRFIIIQKVSHHFCWWWLTSSRNIIISKFICFFVHSKLLPCFMSFPLEPPNGNSSKGQNGPRPPPRRFRRSSQASVVERVEKMWVSFPCRWWAL